MSASESSKAVLCCLETEQLSAVTFVQDYVQLHFDGPCLTAYVWPHVLNPMGSITPKLPGYRDALCECIGKTVLKTFEQPGEKLAIQFADGTTLEISLKEGDREGPEAAMFQDQSGKSWNVW